MTAKPPALAAQDIPEIRGSGYPEPFRSRMGDRAKRKLGDAFGLNQFGVNLVSLGPGGQSALRHWHTLEDEFVYMLEGEVVLITDAGEQVLRAGDCVGYPAAEADAHHFINRSQQPARYLEVGSRIAADVAHYPDDDLAWVNRETRTPDGYKRATTVAAHKDGRPYD